MTSNSSKKWDRHEVRLWGCQPTIHTSYSTDISFGKWIYSLRDDNVDDCIPRLYFGSLLHPIFWGISGCLNDLKLVKNRWDRHEVRLSRCQSTIEMPYSTVISFGKHDMTLTLSFKLTSNTWTREWTSYLISRYFGQGCPNDLKFVGNRQDRNKVRVWQR